MTANTPVFMRYEFLGRSASGGGVFGLGVFLLIVVGFVWIAAPNRSEAQDKQVTVHSKSQFWIQGKATTHSFTCGVEQVNGEAVLPTDQDTVPESADEEQTEVLVTVPVEAFDCGNSRMTRDLKETLKAEEHPEIRFELVHASVGEQIDTSAHWRNIEALGALTIAGKKRLMRVHVAGRAFDEERFRIRGCHPIRMTYFGIEPPSKALGLVKVKNRVEVQFDLFAHVEGRDGNAPFDFVSVSDPPTCSG